MKTNPDHGAARPGPLSLEQAQEVIKTHLRHMQAAPVPLEQSLGRVLAEPVIAGNDQPPFPRSPYDGYALRSADSAGADRNSPVRLTVTGRSFAGSPYSGPVGPGQAVRIMTGGAIPPGTDCVVPQEDTDLGDETVSVYTPLLPYGNYCHRGEDFHTGDLLAESGTPVTAAVAAVAAAAGCRDLCCLPLPKASVVSTGDELQEPGAPLAAGQVYDANGMHLRCRLQELGLDTPFHRRAGDSLGQLTAAIRAGLDRGDVLFTTGGVSVGQSDLVPAALEQLGAEVLFHGVSIKPGMPALLAVVGDKVVLALSGNPFAAAASFEVLGRPVLAALSGDSRFLPRTAAAVLANGFEKASPCLRLLRAKLQDGKAILPPAQGNGQLSTLVGCNCLVEIPAGSGPLAPGTEVRALLL